MKIGLVIYGRIETISGGYLYDRKLVEALRARGDEVEIVSLPWTRYGRHLTHNFSNQLLQQLTTADFDVLLQDELNHPSLFWLNGRLRSQVSYPIISIVHHLRISEAHPRGLMWLYRLVEKHYLQSVDGFIINSQTTRHVVQSLCSGRSPDRAGRWHGEDAGHSGNQSKPHVVAYPAGDRFGQSMTPVEVEDRARQNGRLQILFVGNLIPRKGLHTLLTALAAIPKTEWHLHVVGSNKFDIKYARKIDRLVDTAVLQNNITFHNTLPDNALAEQMKQAHLLTMPSQYEGFGIVYLEGMGFGLPAIGTTSGAAWEIIRDGENGFLLDGEDTAVLAQHIQQLQQNRQQLIRMSLTALQTFQSWPTWQQSTDSICQFLRKLQMNDPQSKKL